MFPPITFTMAGNLEQRLGGIADALDAGFPRAMHQIGQITARSIDLDFLQHGRPTPFDQLSPVTEKRRAWTAAHGGPRPVAGLKTQLRVADTFRKAATATIPTSGSAYSETPNEVVVGADTSRDSPVFYALTATGLSARAGKVGIPERNPVVLQNADVRPIADALLVDLRQTVRREF